ncbi:hypothetical protein C0J52_18445 [Blattella germanica]|nr:hypothetical protein C0J52_18445 [Blattella germanica]
MTMFTEGHLLSFLFLNAKEWPDSGHSRKAQRISWFGHINRMPDESLVKRIYKWQPIGARPTGRPKNRWEDNFSHKESTIIIGARKKSPNISGVNINDLKVITEYYKSF